MGHIDGTKIVVVVAAIFGGPVRPNVLASHRCDLQLLNNLEPHHLPLIAQNEFQHLLVNMEAYSAMAATDECTRLPRADTESSLFK